MEHIYVDESGSMTVAHCDTEKYFIVALVRSKDDNELKRFYKKFVRSHLKELQEADTRKVMFKDGKFAELKGSSFSPKLKKEFVEYACKIESLEVFYIMVDNSKVSERFYSNTARAFNYIVRLALEYYINNSLIESGYIHLQLDERNEKPETKHFLENYLNTEIGLKADTHAEFKVDYFDSVNNKLVQVADVFANLLYSECKTGAYGNEFKLMRESKCLLHVFHFPIK